MREHSASELQRQMDYNGTKETTFMEETYTTCDLVQDAYHLRQCIADNKPEHRTGLTAPTNTMRFHDQKQQENWRVNLSIVAMMMSVRSSLGLHLAFDIPGWALSGNA